LGVEESVCKSPPGPGRGPESSPYTYHFFTNNVHFCTAKLKTADTTETMIKITRIHGVTSQRTLVNIITAV
jgi:hypothetical protein